MWCPRRLDAALSGTTATTNYDVGAAGVYTEIFDLGLTWSVWTTTGYLKFCSSGTVCTSGRGSGRMRRRWADLSNWPFPSGLLANTYSVPTAG